MLMLRRKIGRIHHKLRRVLNESSGFLAGEPLAESLENGPVPES